MTDKKTLGIVGGMGPLSTADFFTKVVLNTDAAADGEHIHVMMDSDPTIPDRTEAVLNGDNGCIAAIKASVKRVAEMGAQVIAMPCNTAHAFFDELANGLENVLFINMVAETVNELLKLGVKKAALLATDGTIKAGVFQQMLNYSGIEVLLPSVEGQAEVMGVIYEGVKADRPYDVTRLNAELARLKNDGAELFILGCTELAPAFVQYKIDEPFIDTAQVLARACVRECGYKLK